MLCKKIVLFCLLGFSLFASEMKVNTKELFDYSSLQLNNSLSLYAAKVNMQNFEDDQAYSIGVMHTITDASVEFAVGYMQPVEQVDALFDPTAYKTLSQQEDGILFFVNCHF